MGKTSPKWTCEGGGVCFPKEKAWRMGARASQRPWGGNEDPKTKNRPI